LWILGMLHMEIIQERLERNSIWPWLWRFLTFPILSLVVNNPTDLPEPSRPRRRAFIKATIITKADFVGNVMSLCIEKRGWLRIRLI
jgi:GTP-binding protein LepA